MNSFVREEKGFRVRGKASTSSKFHSKGKSGTSLEANKQTKSAATTTTTKRARQTSQEWQRKGQDPFSCVRSRKRDSKKRRKAQREKNGEGG